MRYIGSKAKLTGEIRLFAEHLMPSAVTFCDLFAGTGSVGREFRSTHEIVSNDLLYFSYILHRAKVSLSYQPSFKVLKSELGCNPVDFLNAMDTDEAKATEADFVFQNFSPGGADGRSYLSNFNALKIDAIRRSLDNWLDMELISEDEWCYLLAILIDAIPSVSNIAGTYGAYLKGWDNRALKPIVIKHFEIEPSRYKHKSYNEEGLQLLRSISGQLLYLDPPYNSRQYSSNYHLLETVARYDSPTLKGKTGTRVDNSGSSKFCRTKEVRKAFEEVFSSAQFDSIIVSYSSEGLVPIDELIELARKFDSRNKVEIVQIPYRPYLRVSTNARPQLHEYLIGIMK